MQERVVVLGHSFGGRVAVQLAAARPRQVAGLVLSGAPLHQGEGARKRPSPAFRIARQMAARGLVSEDRMEAMRQRHGSADYRAATGVMRAVLVRSLAEDYTSVLGGLSCPTELVWGDDDTAAPLEVARWLEAQMPSAHLVVCPGAGHLTPLTVPGELRAAVERLRP